MLFFALVRLLLMSSSDAFLTTSTSTSTRTTSPAILSSRLSRTSFGFSSAIASPQKRVYSSAPLFSAASAAAADDYDLDSSAESELESAFDDTTTIEETEAGLDQVFDAVDVDASGTIDLEEFNRHLSSAGYSSDAIQSSFSKMDSDQNGEISRAEFRRAILDAPDVIDQDDEGCPRGYFLNSVKQTCEALGPIGRISQKLETLGPFKRTYRRISNLFGVDTKNISKLGVSFVLSYSIISNLNGAISFSVAWYISCKRTGLSPLVPGQWKVLLSSYAMIYGLVQILRPFRVAAAIAMSKLSAEYLEMTQTKLNCSRGVAIGCQYMMGQAMMGVCALIGVSIVSVLTGVPILGR